MPSFSRETLSENCIETVDTVVICFSSQRCNGCLMSIELLFLHHKSRAR
jgi:hypothetical protein